MFQNTYNVVSIFFYFKMIVWHIENLSHLCYTAFCLNSDFIDDHPGNRRFHSRSLAHDVLANVTVEC